MFHIKVATNTAKEPDAERAFKEGFNLAILPIAGTSNAFSLVCANSQASAALKKAKYVQGIDTGFRKTTYAVRGTIDQVLEKLRQHFEVETGEIRK